MMWTPATTTSRQHVILSPNMKRIHSYLEPTSLEIPCSKNEKCH